MSQNQKTLIGSAWRKQSKNGGEYLSLSLKQEDMANLDLANCFIDMSENQKKNKPTSPDYFIFAKPKMAKEEKPQYNPNPGYQKKVPENLRPQRSQAQAPYTKPKSTPQGWDPEDPGF